MGNDYLKKQVVIDRETDVKLIEYIFNQRNFSDLVRKLLYREIEIEKGNMVIVDIETFNKTQKAISYISNNVIDKSNNQNENSKNDDELVNDFLENLK